MIKPKQPTTNATQAPTQPPTSSSQVQDQANDAASPSLQDKSQLKEDKAQENKGGLMNSAKKTEHTNVKKVKNPNSTATQGTKKGLSHKKPGEQGPRGSNASQHSQLFEENKQQDGSSKSNLQMSTQNKSRNAKQIMSKNQKTNQSLNNSIASGSAISGGGGGSNKEKQHRHSKELSNTEQQEIAKAATPQRSAESKVLMSQHRHYESLNTSIKIGQLQNRAQKLKQSIQQNSHPTNQKNMQKEKNELDAIHQEMEQLVQDNNSNCVLNANLSAQQCTTTIPPINKPNRKLSCEEEEFDDRLCNQVDLLLNQKNKKSTDFQNAPSNAGEQQTMKLNAQNLRALQAETDRFQKGRYNKNDPQKQKKKQQRKKQVNPQHNPFQFKTLRSRTETPSKATNVSTNDINESLQKVIEKEQGYVYATVGSTGSRVNQSVVSQALTNIEAKRNATPSKILQKHLQRQQRAAVLRAQLEQNRQQQFEKIKARQQASKGLKDKLQQLQWEKRKIINDKIEHARENKRKEMDVVVQKARVDLQGVEDTKYINKMIQNNKYLDIYNKLNETSERRNMLHQELRKKLEDQKQKEEDAQRRRDSLFNSKLDEFEKAQAKRLQAQQRKQQINNRAQKVEEEKKKRAQVLQRKMHLGEKINGVMSFVNDQDNIWDLIGNEQSFKDGNQNKKDIFQMGMSKVDLLNLEKLQLKQDAQFFNKIISFSDDGIMQVKIDQVDYQQYLQMLRGNEFLANSTSDSSDNDSADERNSNLSSNRIQYKFMMGNNRQGEDLNKSISSYQKNFENSPVNNFVKKQGFNQLKDDCNKYDQNSDALASYGSMRDDLEDPQTTDDAFRQSLNDQLDREESMSTKEIQFNQVSKHYINDLNLANHRSGHALENQHEQQNFQSAQNEGGIINLDMTQSQYSNPFQVIGAQPFITDEEEQLMLIESRIHWSIRRNVLRDTMSEDLEWAQCIKNENEDFLDRIRYQNAHQLNIQETRSLQSTPERRKPMAGNINQREKSCDDRIFGSASSRRRFKRSSRINSRKSSISSSMYQSMHKSKSKDILVSGALNSNGIILLESKKRMNRDNSRDSYDSHRIKGRSSIGSIQPRNLFQNTTCQLNFGINAHMTEDTKDDTSMNLTSQSHATNFGSQMNQLITNMKPIFSFASTKILPKLSTNAQRILFPIREQKILFKRPGIDGQFINVKVTLRLEDMQQMITNTSSLQQTQNIQNQTNAIVSDTTFQIQKTIPVDNSIQQQELLITDKSNESTPNKPQKDQKEYTKVISSGGAAISQSLTTSQQQAAASKTLAIQKDKKEGPNTSSKMEKTPNDKDKYAAKQPEMEEQLTSRTHAKGDKDVVFKEHAIKYLLGGQYNDLIKNEDGQKSIELNDDDPLKIKEIEQFLDRLESGELYFRYCRLCECILNEETASAQVANGPSGMLSGALQESEQVESAANIDEETQQLQNSSPQQAHRTSQNLQNSFQQSDNDQGACQIGDGVDTTERANEVICNEPQLTATDFMRANSADAQHGNIIEPNITGFQYFNDQMVIAHVQNNKHHKKVREELGIKDFEDQCFSILYFGSCPGDISKDLIREKEKALKRKVKRLKVQLQQMAVSHESAGCQQAWKDCASLNKKALQIRCLDLEKQVNPVIRDYEALEQNLKEIVKLLQGKNQGDLMLFRKLKFIPTLVDICKRILICPRHEFKHLGKAIEMSIRIISLFCSLRENRNYMLQTNRIMPLVDLLNWCMNRHTQIFFGIGFLPQLFQIITLHIKHRTPYECIQCKEYLIEVLICSQLMHKIKSKFTIINYPMTMDTSQMMGQVPLFLLKSITFLEALTSIISSDARYRPAYERNNKLGEHYLFVIANTEMFGIINMIATLLLTHSEQFKTSCNSLDSDQNATKIMPQTFLSLSIVSIKVLNNIIRMDVKFVQQLLVKNEILLDQLFHLMNYLLVYAHENYDKNEDTKELLHETLMFIGYFCLLSEKSQQILQRGENTIMQKLCNLPFPYFSDKKLKEILFPTLIMVSYKSERCVAIMNQEISFAPLIKFLQDNMKEELPRIMEEEFDQQSISSLGERGGGGGRRGRSPSMSSTNSSGCSIQMESIGNGNCPYLPLFMRFPKNKWQDAIEFYQNQE